jgi:uncharacterized membrane protein
MGIVFVIALAAISLTVIIPGLFPSFNTILQATPTTGFDDMTVASINAMPFIMLGILVLCAVLWVVMYNHD